MHRFAARANTSTRRLGPGAVEGGVVTGQPRLGQFVPSKAQEKR